MRKVSKVRTVEEMNEAKNKYYLFLLLAIAAVFYLGYIFNVCVLSANTTEYRNYCLQEKNSTGIIISLILLIVGVLGYRHSNREYKQWKSNL